MKKTLLFLTALALSISSSYGQLLMYEPFNYTDGAQTAVNELVRASGGNWVLGPSQNSNAVNDDIVTSPFIAEMFGLPGQTGNAYFFRGGNNDPARRFTAQTSGTIFWSALIKIDGWIGNGTTAYAPNSTGKQLISLTNNWTTTADIAYPGSLVVKGASVNEGETSYYLGVSNEHIDSAAKGAYGTTVYAGGVQHLVVLSYEFATNTTKLWVDPVVPTNGTMTTSSPVATIVGPGTVSEVAGFFIRLDSNVNTPNTTIDEIRVAKTWAQAVGQSVPLSVAKNEIEGLKVYPNPAKDYITIESKNVKLTSVELYNVLGSKVLSSKSLTNDRLNVSGVSKGIYMLQVNADGASSTRKIVIE